MSTYTISAPSSLQCSVKLPASKSISNRALIIQALSGSSDMPVNLSDCDDTEVVMHALRYMPATVDVKAGGTAMRFLTAYLCMMSGEHVITGTDRMKQRPIGILVDALRQLGAKIDYLGREGFPPLKISGSRLVGGMVEMDGSVSSQFVSALLMLSPMIDGGVKIRLHGEIISRPYIDLTLSTMRTFGAEAEWADIDLLEVKPVPYRFHPYFIENDWCSAGYWYEMVALSADEQAEVTLSGLSDDSLQGDSVVRYLFNLLGVRTLFAPHAEGELTTVTIRKHPMRVSRLEYDFVNAPDLAQTFVVCCCLMGIKFHFTGLKTLTIKETDRLSALITEMRKLGYVLRCSDSTELEWLGERCTSDADAVIDTYADHRMALSFAPVACRQAISIKDPGVVTKSYPNFWNDMREAGFSIRQSTN